MTVRELWTAIRKKCRQCCNEQLAEIRHCLIYDCSLWPYRMGKDHPVQSVPRTDEPQIVSISEKSVA